MTADKAWTVNAIKDAMRARGSHWWDPDTMRQFGTKPLPTVYQGPGGVFFVTQDRQFDGSKGYTVRSFDPASAEIDTVGGLADKSKRRAEKIARDMAAGSAIGQVVTANEEAFKPVSVVEQFVADLAKHASNPRTPPDSPMGRGLAEALVIKARRHHRLMEQLCNGEIETDDDGNNPAVNRCRGEVKTLAGELGAKAVLFSGDPRGCTVKLTFEDGYTNDFGSEGYCVPTSLKQEE